MRIRLLLLLLASLAAGAGACSLPTAPAPPTGTPTLQPDAPALDSTSAGDERGGNVMGGSG